jgi:LmbE family N-acetylglucosaminyl deacetylase
MRLDSLPRRTLVDLIEKDSKLSIEKLQPTIIAIPAISYNQDHEAVFKAAFTACRPHIPTVKPFQKIVLAYDSPTLSWDPYNRGFHPNFYVDISNYIDQKIQAISIYETQLRLYIHQHSKDTIMSLATLRGREVAVEAAEGFMCYRFVI